jgi:hypothetical protein
MYGIVIGHRILLGNLFIIKTDFAKINEILVKQVNNFPVLLLT